MLIFLSKEMSSSKMARLLKFQIAFPIRLPKSLIVQISSLYLEVSILIHICNFLLWERMQLMILTVEAKLLLLEEQHHSSILPFLLLKRQCQLLMKDGEVGLIQKSIVIMDFMLQLRVGIHKLLERWKEWLRMESQVSSFSWLIKEFSDWMMLLFIRLSKMQEIWEQYVLSMPKMVILLLKIKKNFWKKASLALKVITYLVHNPSRPKQFIESSQSLNMLTCLFTSFT